MPGGNQANFRNTLYRDCLLCINNLFHCHSTLVYWLGNQRVQKKKNFSMAAGIAPAGFLSDHRQIILNHKFVQQHTAQYPYVPNPALT